MHLFSEKTHSERSFKKDNVNICTAQKQSANFFPSFIPGIIAVEYLSDDIRLINGFTRRDLSVRHFKGARVKWNICSLNEEIVRFMK